jgi:hypothetical protein
MVSDNAPRNTSKLECSLEYKKGSGLKYLIKSEKKSGKGCNKKLKLKRNAGRVRKTRLKNGKIDCENTKLKKLFDNIRLRSAFHI